MHRVWDKRVFLSDNAVEQCLKAMQEYGNQLVGNAGRRNKELEIALERAIGTIEMECDDLDYLNELKSILNNGNQKTS